MKILTIVILILFPSCANYLTYQTKTVKISKIKKMDIPRLKIQKFKNH